MTLETVEVFSEKREKLTFEGTKEDAIQLYIFLYAIRERGYKTFTLKNCSAYLKKHDISLPEFHGVCIRYMPFSQLFSENNSTIKVEWSNSLVRHYSFDSGNLAKYMLMLQRILLDEKN
jgi:hypothetical protein